MMILPIALVTTSLCTLTGALSATDCLPGRHLATSNLTAASKSLRGYDDQTAASVARSRLLGNGNPNQGNNNNNGVRFQELNEVIQALQLKMETMENGLSILKNQVDGEAEKVKNLNVSVETIEAGMNNNMGTMNTMETNLMTLINDNKLSIEDLQRYFVNWSQPAKLTADDGVSRTLPLIGDTFGYSVAIDGDTAVVGTRYGGNDTNGLVYVFIRSSEGTWSPQAELTAEGEYFGYSVAIDGDTVVIGAYGDDHNCVQCGSAYVFVRDGTTWSQQAKLTSVPPLGGTSWGEHFGYSVAIDGNTAVIGAMYGSPGILVHYKAGVAYVFERSGPISTGTWSQARIVASDGSIGDSFGVSVAIDGDTAIIGACRDDHNGVQCGSAYVFVRESLNNWSQQAKLTAGDGAESDHFGRSVAISGNTAVIGSGSVYVFVRDGTTWSQQGAKLLPSDYNDGAYDNYFGWSVAIYGNTAVIGAIYDDDNGNQSGSANVFVRDGVSWSYQDKLLASEGAQDDYFSGISVAIDGNTVVISAYGDDDNSAYSGSAYVFTH